MNGALEMTPADSAWLTYLTTYYASLRASATHKAAGDVYDARVHARVTDRAALADAWSDYLATHDAHMVAIATHKAAGAVYDALPSHIRTRRRHAASYDR